eukprot:EG_transcript_10844
MDLADPVLPVTCPCQPIDAEYEHYRLDCRRFPCPPTCLLGGPCPPPCDGPGPAAAAHREWHALHAALVPAIEALLEEEAPGPLPCAAHHNTTGKRRRHTDLEEPDLRQALRATAHPSAGRVVACPRETVERVAGQTYVVPRDARFLWADHHILSQRVAELGRFELVVMDPPWPSHSVHRSKAYRPLSFEDLRRLPVPQLLQGGPPPTFCLVWVTNSPRVHAFVMEELFPCWGLTLVRQVVWLKVALDGRLVYPLHNRHRRPYEVALLATTQPACCVADLPAPRPALAARGGGAATLLPPLVFRALPTAHSRKPRPPALYEWLERLWRTATLGSLHDGHPRVPAEEEGEEDCHEPDGHYMVPLDGKISGDGMAGSGLTLPYRRLEMFARSVHAGWTCWGDEVLKFQWAPYFMWKPPPPLPAVDSLPERTLQGQYDAEPVVPTSITP